MTTPSVLSVDDVRARHERLRDRIERAGGESVELVAVTKGFDVSAAQVALALGLVDLGENYAQEMLAKVEALGTAAGGSRVSAADPRWHFIGRLQRNKVRGLAPHVRLWQSVDRAAVGREIAKRASGASVLVQLNLSGEDQKGGCPPETAPGLVAELTDMGLDVRGLMGVGPQGPAEDARPGFRTLVTMADELSLPVRSIGMSHDLEVAIEEGASMVRVGRELFGPRPA